MSKTAVQATISVVTNWRIAPILTTALVLAAALARPFDEDAPPGLARKVAERESETALAHANYTYRQTVIVEELDRNGGRAGEYREMRDIIFSPTGERTEQFLEKPRSTLKNLKLTDEDFRDIRDVQPFMLTADQLFLYQTEFRGDETVDGIDCFVLQIRPKQVLSSQRLFDGLLWIDKRDSSIIRTAGEAVPQIVTLKTENLFPHFTTVRSKIDGDHWFPLTTYADDTLNFRNGPQRIRMIIRYNDYKRFSTDTKIVTDR